MCLIHEITPKGSKFNVGNDLESRKIDWMRIGGIWWQKPREKGKNRSLEIGGQTPVHNWAEANQTPVHKDKWACLRNRIQTESLTRGKRPFTKGKRACIMAVYRQKPRDRDTRAFLPHQMPVRPSNTAKHPFSSQNQIPIQRTRNHDTKTTPTITYQGVN